MSIKFAEEKNDMDIRFWEEAAAEFLETEGDNAVSDCSSG